MSVVSRNAIWISSTSHLSTILYPSRHRLRGFRLGPSIAPETVYLFVAPLTPPTAPLTSLSSPLARKMEEAVRELSYSATLVNDEHPVPSQSGCPLVPRGHAGRACPLTTHTLRLRNDCDAALLSSGSSEPSVLRSLSGAFCHHPRLSSFVAALRLSLSLPRISSMLRSHTPAACRRQPAVPQP
jgi:hypothetical protein